MISLYQIDQEYLQIAELLISNGGEASEEIETALQINKEQLQNKAVNYAFVIKEIEGKADLIGAEIERLTALKAIAVKSANRLRQSISGAMQMHGIEKVEIPTLKISFRKSETCEIEDESAIPAQFIKVKIVEPIKSVDKTAIKAAIKAGETVPGARLQEHQNLQIK